jgi:hypothetical protein
MTNIQDERLASNEMVMAAPVVTTNVRCDQRRGPL